MQLAKKMSLFLDCLLLIFCRHFVGVCLPMTAAWQYTMEIVGDQVCIMCDDIGLLKKRYSK